jgi:hypothetical protein
VRRREGHMVAGCRGHGAEASSSRAGRSAPGDRRVDDPPAFADAREEQELWGELRDHGAALNRALNEALRIHGCPAWRVFQVRRRRLLSLVFSSSRATLAAGRSQVSACRWKELEHRARDKYGAFNRMSAELRQLRERCDAFDALADAVGLRTVGCRTRLWPCAISSRSAKGRMRRALHPRAGLHGPHRSG